MSRKVTLVLGGSFNPVHSQHVEIMRMAKECLEKANYDVVEGYLAPSTDSYLSSKTKSKQNDYGIKKEHRINMVNLAVEKYAWLKPVHECYETAYACGKSNAPTTHELAILVGADRAMANDGKPKWRRTFKQPQLTVIIGRPQGDANKSKLQRLWQDDLHKNRVVHAEKYFLVDDESQVDISSTRIREDLKFLTHHGKPDLTLDEQNAIDTLVSQGILDAKVAKYLVDNRNDLFL